MRVCHLKLGRTWWKLTFRPRSAAERRQRVIGLCDDDAKTIEIDDSAKGKRLLAALIHETIHAIERKMPHNRVNRLEEAVVKVLWHEGWRQI